MRDRVREKGRKRKHTSTIHSTNDYTDSSSGSSFLELGTQSRPPTRTHQLNPYHCLHVLQELEVTLNPAIRTVDISTVRSNNTHHPLIFALIGGYIPHSLFPEITR